MNILSFSRMKLYNNDGSGRIILKLRLPRMESDVCGADSFNRFYERLAEGYISSAEHCPFKNNVGARPAKVYVDFLRVTDEYIKKHRKSREKNGRFEVIKREMRINTDGKTWRFECFDVYDAERELFVK